ncbi:hypothetical protein CK203_065081 [Vitis vinifera]|uniref:Uncharacterized protein n=1 Tax=Vitis vinifera TaxID=29760 RepID=A0A438FP51_VITVI|nr:hypothetical protein CK203_065081 [Vitis vinifera]
MVEEVPPFWQQEKCSGEQANLIGQWKPIQMLPMATRTTLAGGTTQTLHGSQGQTHISHQPNQANRVKVNPQLSKHSLTNLNTVNEKGKFPSQPHQNPKGIHEVESKDEDSSKVRDVQDIITLRSGKEVHQPEHDQRKAKEDKADRKEERRKNKRERKFR